MHTIIKNLSVTLYRDRAKVQALVDKLTADDDGGFLYRVADWPDGRFCVEVLDVEDNSRLGYL